MKHKYELIDSDGRYMIAEHDDETNTLSVTTYLSPAPDVPIEETLEMCGFTITSKLKLKKPKIIPITKGK